MSTTTLKRSPSMEDLEGQTAIHLPDRETLGLVTIIITDVLNNNTVTVNVQNNKVAVQVCAAVAAIASGFSLPLTCSVAQ